MATFISENILSEGGITGTTISATTYSNLPTDNTITGGTYGSGTATFRNNTGGTFTVTGFLSNATTAVTLSSNVLSVTSSGGTATNTTINAATGGTYSNGTITLAGTGTLSTITGLFTGGTDVRVTGATYSNNNFTFTNNTGGTFSVLFNTVTGLTTNGNLTVTGTTSSGVISATTYQNLPLDIRVTGGTYSSGTATFTNNTGGTFTVTGFSTGGGGTFTGGTVTGPTNFTGGLTANTISGGSIVVNTINSTNQTLTEPNGDIRVSWSDGHLLNATNLKVDWNNGYLNSSTGLLSVDWENMQLFDTVTPSISVDWRTRNLIDGGGNIKLDWQSGVLSGMTSIGATTISGGTLYGDGSNLTGIGGGSFITGDTASVQARRTTLYALTGSYANITLDVTDVENSSSVVAHDNTNTDRIYMYESGLYEIHYHGDIGQGTSANDFETRLYLNNLTAINGSSLSGKSSSTDRITLASNTIFSATSGDYITLQARYPALAGGSIGNTVLSVKQLKGIKGDTGPTGAQGPQGIGLFTGGTINVNTNFTAGLSANTFVVTSTSATSLNFVTTPTNNNANTEILTRNSTTGNVEYRTASSIGGGGSSSTGIVYVFANNYQLI